MPQIGPAEILVILLVGLLVFGPHRLPEIGRQVGKGMRELRKFQDTVKGELDQVLNLHDDEPSTLPAAKPNELPPPAKSDDSVPSTPRAGAHAPSRYRPADARPSASASVSRPAPAPERPGAHAPSRFRRPRNSASRLTRSRGHFPPTQTSDRARPTGRCRCSTIWPSSGTGSSSRSSPWCIGGIVVFFLSNQIIEFLVTYYEDATQGDRDALIFLGPADAFLTRLKVATYGGIVLALPDLALPAVALHHPGPEPEGEAVRDPVRGLRDRAVRPRARSSRSSPSSRRCGS